jgi:hypothetical protein
LLVASAATVVMAPAAGAATKSIDAPGLPQSGTVAKGVPAGPGKVRYLKVPNKTIKAGTLNASSTTSANGASTALSTLPFFSANVFAPKDGNTYPFTLVGPSFLSPSPPVTIPTVVIPIVFTFTPTGDVYDPNSTNGACGETQSPVSGLLNSPEFKRKTWVAGGTNIGVTQYPDASMREEFWQFANPGGSDPTYHVYLAGSSPFSINVSANYPEINAGTCNNLGEIDFASWDSFVQGTLMPILASNGIGPTDFPIFEFKNVVMTQSSGTSCCILGYHGSFNNPSFSNNAQQYATADYVTDNEFGSTTDVAAISHEIAEMLNDPFGNNPTPNWGHIGQVSGCQNNLEVGDPLSGTDFTVHPPNPGGPTYHLQEMAFFGWFFGQSYGVNGWFSTRGAFTTSSAACS